MIIDPRSTLVLVPGAGGSAFYWHRLVAELHRRGVVVKVLSHGGRHLFDAGR